jgi:putative peptidoglycan lipid II flippase
MSTQAPTVISPTPTPDSAAVAPAAPAPAKSFVRHAKLISALTLLSRFFGLAREMAQANYFGTGMVAGAFRVAFVVPNLFRKLFGEGALAAAFIPLYVQAIKNESPDAANRFAGAAITLLVVCLSAITVVGEAIVATLILTASPDVRPDWLLTLKLTAVMLPYVILICGTAFLSAVLQVHKRFGPPAINPVILNAVHIAVMVAGGYLLHLKDVAGNPDELVRRQTTLAYWLASFVLVAGLLQVLSLQPALRAAGFRVRLVRSFWTPGIKRLFWLSAPVALGAGVLQLSVFMDKAIAAALAQYLDRADHLVTHFTLWGHTLPLPMKAGAIARLDLAQFLYQFPLGVFAIALATAIFPALSADAVETDRTKFKNALRQGIDLSLFEGFAASVGLIIVREPAIRLLFRHGFLPESDVHLIANSLAFYASAIWAFSLLQIINRAYYALHDTRTPFVMSVVNIVLNLVVELPLCFTHLGESAMALGTTVSFSIQAVLMLWMLNRRAGGLDLPKTLRSSAKMLAAAALMYAACLGVQHLPFYPHTLTKFSSALQLATLMATGATVYLAACYALGLDVMHLLLPKRTRPATAASA